MLDRDSLRHILEIAMKNGGDFADVYIERKKTNGISCEANQIERVVTGLDVGAGIRVIDGENTAYAFTNELTRSGLENVADVVSHAVRKNQPHQVMDLRKIEPLCKFELTEPPDQVSIDSKVDVVQRANQAARDIDQRIKQVTVGYGDVIQEITIVNSEGSYVEDRRTRTRLAINVVAAEGATIQTGYDAAGAFSGFELFKNSAPEDVAREAAGRALMMLKAKPAPAGKMPVVMAGEAGGTMVHEACGHGLEADLVQKKLSVYAGKMGQQVASPLVTVIDDATIPGKYGSLCFDDEGTPGEKTVLIKDGVLKAYMYDWFTARKDGCRSTGNGRRESYQDRPIPRMTNTCIAPGKEDPEKIIRETKKGLLVKKMGGGQVNTTNGDFVFDVAEGYLIEDGKIGAPVRGATLTGNGPDVLRIIDMVGKDLGFAIGTCGKDGQGVPVSDAQPTLRIPELIVGGILD
ncbi:MAG: TldD/PmbA family protein [Bacillota bacterium]